MSKVAVGLLALATLAGCSPGPGPTATAPSTGPTAAYASSSNIGTEAPTRQILLITSRPSGRQQFSSLDPANPQVRVPVTAPPGRWSMVGAATGVALSSNQDPPVVVLSTLSAPSLLPQSTINLPAGDRWLGGYAACLSDDGRLLAADAGLVFFFYDGSEFREIPGQRNNRGSCAWLDDSNAVWDAEDGSIVAWDASSNMIVDESVGDFKGRRVSSGGGLLSRVAPNDDLVVTVISVGGNEPVVGAEVGRLKAASIGQLSSDGRWLVVQFLDGTSALYPVSEAGFGQPAALTLSDDERVAWTTVNR